MLGEVEKLMGEGEHRTAEEDAALELMARLIKDYEEEHHPLADPSPQEMLVYPMEQRSLKQADLLPIFKSRGYVSDVVNAKRAISKAPSGLPSFSRSRQTFSSNNCELARWLNADERGAIR